ncbi:WD and tetratricopeptide repeat protein, putative isoform 1 [Hibiscus syriacus]|uniref:WD and tetratricopeptide repeat protein, putative isoform 1 n=1 Tax=Hibiscus syriacus TaxID=106335 RepID=A0A6A3BJ15_HIBSY|nr:WD and tetratricopeptide repeat protein, putative isoform 1 [Hibiscus syriacus]
MRKMIIYGFWPSCKENCEDDGKNKRKGDYSNDGAGFKGAQRNKNLKQKFVNRPKSTEKRPPCTTRKGTISNARLEEELRTRKAEEVSNGGHITRHVFRNKVRRYKLLDDVSS